MAMWSRVRRLLAGADGATRAGLPLAELLAPVPLGALLVLAVNDWWLKSSHAPRWLTGKLSDLAGIFVFPLVATAACDLLLWAAWRLGAPVDFTLRRWKLGVAVALTAIGFAVLKLWPDGSDFLVRAMRLVAPRTHVALDPTDVAALATLPLTWWYGRRVLARGAYGRAAWALRRRATAPFADAAACGAPAEVVATLHAALAAADLATADAALARLRA
ncbi:MAG TPA: hypothetical protein VMJ10_01855 [Kofleriaceae bacterium]|nr:hypothetical protein [Kofleriaceae bacterium]